MVSCDSPVHRNIQYLYKISHHFFKYMHCQIDGSTKSLNLFSKHKSLSGRSKLHEGIKEGDFNNRKFETENS